MRKLAMDKFKRVQTRRKPALAMALVALMAAGATLTMPVIGQSAGVESEQRQQLHEHLTLYGAMTQGALVVGQTTPGYQVEFNGQALQVSANGYFTFGIGRDETAVQELIVSAPRSAQQEDSSPLVHQFEVTEREFNIQRIDGLPQQTVTPDPQAQARIRDENRQIAQARQVRSDLTYFTGPYRWPAEGRISGVYGSQRILNGEPRAPHWGIDIAAPTGTAVYAPIGGIVVLAHADMLMSGGTLIVDHGHGVFSSFLHLHRILVSEGEHLKQGDPIAEIGATGRATGPHLDWRMNWESTRVDPQLLLPARDN